MNQMPFKGILKALKPMFLYGAFKGLLKVFERPFKGLPYKVLKGHIGPLGPHKALKGLIGPAKGL